MSKFSRQDVISLLNKILPPSSNAIASPGELSPDVQLIQHLFPPSWFFDGISTESFTGTLGSISVVTNTVPAGRYRWVHAAHLLQIAAGTVVGRSFGISILQVASVLGTTVAEPFPTKNTVSNQFAAGISQQATVSIIPRPLILPPGYALQGFGTSTEAAMQLRLEYMYRELAIGEPFYSV